MHREHVLQTVFPVEIVYVLPTHEGHEIAPTVELAVPAGHWVHTVAEEEPVYDLAAQAVQVLAPLAPLNDPALHCAQTDEPEFAAKLPAVQMEHTLCPVEAAYPDEHERHVDCPPEPA